MKNYLIITSLFALFNINYNFCMENLKKLFAQQLSQQITNLTLDLFGKNKNLISIFKEFFASRIKDINEEIDELTAKIKSEKAILNNATKDQQNEAQKRINDLEELLQELEERKKIASKYASYPSEDFLRSRL